MDAIFDSFLSFDLSVFEWIQTIQNSILTTIMVVITTLGDEGIIFIAAGLVLFITKKYRKIGLMMGVVPDKLILLAAEKSNEAAAGISHFYEYYCANINTFKNSLIEMIDKAFGEEK